MTTYYVFRRNDGYVDAVAYPGASGDLTILLVTEDWDEAKARIVAERDDRHFAVVATWD